FVQAFRRNLPNVSVICEAVEDSTFFDRTFDGVVAWGLIFLLPAEAQRHLIRRIAGILVPGGRLLFTASAEPLVECGTVGVERCDDGIRIMLSWSRGIPEPTVGGWPGGDRGVRGRGAEPLFRCFQEAFEALTSAFAGRRLRGHGKRRVITVMTGLFRDLR